MIRDLNINDFVYMLLAARWTIVLSSLAIVGGGVVGLVIVMGRLSRFRAVRAAAFVYIQFLQATPVLMQLFLLRRFSATSGTAACSRFRARNGKGHAHLRCRTGVSFAS